MDIVFSTQELPEGQRYRAWQEALCCVYVRVDTRRDAVGDYQGFVKEARFGEVTITDCFLSPQEISRRWQHIARIDKDCLYVALMQKGHQSVEQGGQVLGCGPGEGCLFSASDPYVLRNVEPYRAL